MNNPERILADLITFKTDTNVYSNKEMVDYICHFLDNKNILYKRIFNTESQLENLIVGLNINDWQNINTGLVLSGHMDTVSANLKKWETNPYQPVYRDNRLYGRGTVDMKYFIAVVLSVLDKSR
jgi:acetylornithine deacetylase